MIHRTLCSIALSICCGASHADVVTIRADEWYPMNGTPGSATPGFMIEIAEYGLKKAGHTLDYDIMPWERAVASANSGDIDCVVGAYKEDAPKLVFPDIPMGMDVSGFFVKKGGSFDYSANNLGSVKLGAIGGYSYDGGPVDKHLEANANSAKVHLAKGNDALDRLVKMLAAGRVDVVIESPSVMGAKLKEAGLMDAIVEADRLDEETPMYVACTPTKPASKEYVKAMADGLRELRASGKLDDIMAKYGLKDWTK